ncbi:MAG TPA: iron-containing alcohol dehydrogenase [Pyrinomonadaceae bacterium]|nr:iron-containing alcohol dehydrogenase [Pyrinomonadaceae bacterium]
MKEFDFQSRTRVVFGPGVIERLGELARELNFKRTLLVADHGMVASGHVDEAVGPLEKAGVEVVRYHDFEVNPDTRMVENGTAFVSPLNVDSIIGLGGGSSMDCAKGINFLLTNGGQMAEYRGYGKATKPMLPMIAIPTTAGTGSEAQSYALISDVETHAKMACGDPKASFRVAVLDPALTISQPRSITATSGFDAIAHAVETYVTLRRNPLSELFSREAWRLLEPNYERVLSQPDNISARGAMQLGAYYAGVAIENSMLGATHACANPLTARYGTAHGAAIAMLLPTVVRWNEETGTDYCPLLSWSSIAGRNNQMTPGEELARRLEELAEAGGLRNNLRSAGVSESELPELAADAAEQWTGTFNPRPLDTQGAIEIYRCAY